ncbi:suppressor protein SRP40-like [Actinia tenebrosa]|uniref:Suppressor protein SRP40-like n=1 Tax=Actinia tenebrosa TaxID=6105 RepID=A0A6P8J9U2_ACTTE|nr:suppressor protein SRP40-like [Actinia tenebrosa]
MENPEKLVSEMDSTSSENKAPQEKTFEWNKQDDSRTAGPSSTSSPCLTTNRTEMSPSEWEFVTYREIPYEPFEFWDELRNQTPTRNIVVTSSRLRALNPRILADFDENADKVLMEHDETQILPENVSDNEDNAALNEDVSPVNSNRSKNSSNYSSDSEIQSPEDGSSEDSDFSLHSSLHSSLLSSDSDSWIGRSRRARRRSTRRLARKIDSSSGSSDSLDEVFSGRKSEFEESLLDTSSISDMSDVSVAGVFDSDDDLFSWRDS